MWQLKLFIQDNTFDQNTSLRCHLCNSDIFNMNIFHCDLINFLKILRSWPQNKYHLSGEVTDCAAGWQEVGMCSTRNESQGTYNVCLC